MNSYNYVFYTMDMSGVYKCVNNFACLFYSDNISNKCIKV